MANRLITTEMVADYIIKSASDFAKERGIPVEHVLDSFARSWDEVWKESDALHGITACLPDKAQTTPAQSAPTAPPPAQPE